MRKSPTIRCLYESESGIPDCETFGMTKLILAETQQYNVGLHIETVHQI